MSVGQQKKLKIWRPNAFTSIMAQFTVEPAGEDIGAHYLHIDVVFEEEMPTFSGYCFVKFLAPFTPCAADAMDDQNHRVNGLTYQVPVVWGAKFTVNSNFFVLGLEPASIRATVCCRMAITKVMIVSGIWKMNGGGRTLPKTYTIPGYSLARKKTTICLPARYTNQDWILGGDGGPVALSVIIGSNDYSTILTVR